MALILLNFCSKWATKSTLKELVAEMVPPDFIRAKRDALVKLAGFQTDDHHE